MIIFVRCGNTAALILIIGGEALFWMKFDIFDRATITIASSLPRKVKKLCFYYLTLFSLY